MTVRLENDIALYRIPDNDLLSRPGQTLFNLRFSFEHELLLPCVKKYFVLNRIADQAVERTVSVLLILHGQKFIRIPFKKKKYMKNEYLLEDFPKSDFFYSSNYMSPSKIAKLRTIDYTFHRKMNNVSRFFHSLRLVSISYSLYFAAERRPQCCYQARQSKHSSTLGHVV